MSGTNKSTAHCPIGSVRADTVHGAPVLIYCNATVE